MKIDWTEPALNDLESTYQYIARDSEYYAKRFVRRIFEELMESPLKLAQFMPLSREEIHERQ